MSVLLLLVAFAEAAPTELLPAPSGGVGFVGRSTAGEVRGRLDVFTCTLDLQAGTGQFVGDPTTLTTGYGPRDQRMLVYALDVVNHPEVRFEVARIEGAVREMRSGTGTGLVRLVGTLTIRGVAQPLVVNATYTWQGDALRLSGELPLTLDSFGIPDPSVVIARFDNTLSLSFDLVGTPP